MQSSVLHVVIEESLRINSLNELSFLSMPRPTVNDKHKRVFKDYILSPDVFPVEVQMN